MAEKKPDQAARTTVPSLNQYGRIWNILAYAMLAIGLAVCLVDPGVQPQMKLAALALSALWAGWYWLFVIRYYRRERSSWQAGLSFIFAIAISIALSWIHAAFLMTTFSFYGLTFSVMAVGWAIPLVVLLSLTLAWRIAGFYGGFSTTSFPIFIYFLISAAFTILLGLFINNIVQQNRQKQRMIDDLEQAHHSLAQVERQAGMLEERQRLAGEIHDTLAQGLTSIVMHLEAAEGALETNPEAVRQHIDRARQTARQSLAEARRTLWALRPDVVVREPLALALQRIGQSWSEESGLPLKLEVTGVEYPLPAAIEVTLLKTAQEVLVNVRKHSQAKCANLTLTYMEDEVILDVQDDGVGFDPSQAAAQARMGHGYGLLALRERASQLGGRLDVESAPGEGTTVVIALPVLHAEGA
jgi:signal transduction histidine kinase